MRSVALLLLVAALTPIVARAASASSSAARFARHLTLLAEQSPPEVVFGAAGSIHRLAANGSTDVTLVDLRGDNAYCTPGFPICNNPVLGIPNDYNYVPSVMLDSKFRTWWCAGDNGDTVYHAETTDITSGWSPPVPVFRGTHVEGDWDGEHTCDPSVLRVDGNMYLYYGGFPMGTVGWTQVGVALSGDNGLSFKRVRSTPIISPAKQSGPATGAYGAGQPSVIHLDGLFYILYTDTTGRYGYGNFAYVMRSPDPFFQTNVEELHGVGGGFWPYSEANHTIAPLIDCASVDWVFSDVLDRFIVGCDGYNGTATRLMMYDRGLSKFLGYVDAPGQWTEGPGLLKRPDQHSPFYWDINETNKVPIDILRSWGTGGPATWGPPSGGLAHSGGNLVEHPTPADLPRRVLRALEGSAIQVPNLPVAVVMNGTRLQIASIATVQTFCSNYYSVTQDLYYSVPYGASLYEGNKCLGAPGRPAAFLLDDGRLWPVSCIGAITENGSSITEVTVEVFDTYPIGPPIYCI